MADQEQQVQQQQQQLDQQMQSVQQQQQPEMEHMISCVDALEAALLSCLNEIELNQDHVAVFETPLITDFNESVIEPESVATELLASDDRPPQPDHQTDVEKHARDFMEAAKKLQQYFISLRREDKPTKAETLKKEIAAMEEEFKTKDELIQKQEKVIQQWKEELRGQLDKHNAELERV